MSGFSKIWIKHLLSFSVRRENAAVAKIVVGFLTCHFEILFICSEQYIPVKMILHYNVTQGPRNVSLRLLGFRVKDALN